MLLDYLADFVSVWQNVAADKAVVKDIHLATNESFSVHAFVRPWCLWHLWCKARSEQ